MYKRQQQQSSSSSSSIYGSMVITVEIFMLVLLSFLRKRYIKIANLTLFRFPLTNNILTILSIPLQRKTSLYKRLQFKIYNNYVCPLLILCVRVCTRACAIKFYLNFLPFSQLWQKHKVYSANIKIVLYNAGFTEFIFVRLLWQFLP